jgi:hypothetical protein
MKIQSGLEYIEMDKQIMFLIRISSPTSPCQIRI